MQTMIPNLYVRIKLSDKKNHKKQCQNLSRRRLSSSASSSSLVSPMLVPIDEDEELVDFNIVHIDSFHSHCPVYDNRRNNKKNRFRKKNKKSNYSNQLSPIAVATLATALFLVVTSISLAAVARTHLMHLHFDNSHEDFLGNAANTSESSVTKNPEGFDMNIPIRAYGSQKLTIGGDNNYRNHEKLVQEIHVTQLIQDVYVMNQMDLDPSSFFA